MSIHLLITGGKGKNYRSIERLFPNAEAALGYLTEWKVPDKVTSSSFEIHGNKFLLSHDMKEIRSAAETHIDLPDTELTLAVAKRFAAASAPILSLTPASSRPPSTTFTDVGDTPTYTSGMDKHQLGTQKPAVAKKSFLASDLITPMTGVVPPMSGTTGAIVVLKEICRRPEVNMDPRVARQKLRKSMGGDKTRWEWPESEVPRIVALLLKK